VLDEHISETEEGITIARTRGKNAKDVSDAIRRTNEDTTGLKSAQKELYDELVTAGMGAKEARETVAIYTANSRIMAASRGANHAEWFRENRPVFRKGQEMASGARPRVNPDGSPVFFQEDYRGSHTAPTKKDGEQANPLHDIATVYPEDIYGPMAARYYGHGDKTIDDQSVRIIRQFRHNPNAKVTIYRAVPKGVAAEINAGDWVTINPQYAKMHGVHALNGKYKVIKKTVYARDIYTDGNSIHEWGYDPQPEVSKEEIAAMKNRQRMYQSGNMYQTTKGSIHWENGRAVMQLFATADASTGIHELLGHYMTQNLLDMGAQEDAPEWMKKDRQTALEWAGITDWD